LSGEHVLRRTKGRGRKTFELDLSDPDKSMRDPVFLFVSISLIDRAGAEASGFDDRRIGEVVRRRCETLVSREHRTPISVERTTQKMRARKALIHGPLPTGRHPVILVAVRQVVPQRQQ
jgi:hypothetical protein